MGDKEWSRSGSFIKKPNTGWLHDDDALSHGDGVYYPVKYVGTIPCALSMRSVRFEDRTIVTREAITQCCEASGIKEPRRRKLSSVTRQCLPSPPEVKMLNIKLTISTTGIALVVIESNRVIANHIMPCISFATGGAAEDYDVIGYIAKDSHNVRECHVFDCGHMAHDIMATIGQAFELRYKAFLKKGNQPVQQMGSRAAVAAPLPPRPVQSRAPPPVSTGYTGGEQLYDEAGGGTQLYDDLPGGQYGDSYGGGEATYGDVNYGDVKFTGGQVYDNAAGGAAVKVTSSAMYGDDDVDDYNAAQEPTYGDVSYGSGYGEPNFGDQTYDVAGTGKSSDYDDVMINTNDGLMMAPGGSELSKNIASEPWYHGSMSRDEADVLLRDEGDFLVRVSGAGDQYVLTALQDGDPKHLLLVDPEGRVRTKDMQFDSVSHLMNYHLRARIPIISRGSRVTLGQPVPKIHFDGTAAYDFAANK